MRLSQLSQLSEEIDDQIERVRSQFGEATKTDRAVKTGDYVLINLTSTKNNNEIKDFTFSDRLYEVGTGSLIKSLDSKLEGVASGAIIKFTDNIEQINEENVDVTVLVKEVREKILPDLTDEWVSETTEFEDINELKKNLRKILKISRNNKLHRNIKQG